MATLVNLLLVCGVALMGVSSATCASAQDLPDFYKGKTISLYVGSTIGPNRRPRTADACCGHLSHTG